MIRAGDSVEFNGDLWHVLLDICDIFKAIEKDGVIIEAHIDQLKKVNLH